MMAPLECTGHDGLDLAARIRRGEVGSVKFLDAAIAQIERHNRTASAVIRKRYEQARSESARVSSNAPSAGVPFLLKDLIASIASEPTRCGNRLLAALSVPRVWSSLAARTRQNSV